MIISDSVSNGAFLVATGEENIPVASQSERNSCSCCSINTNKQRKRALLIVKLAAVMIAAALFATFVIMGGIFRWETATSSSMKVSAVISIAGGALIVLVPSVRIFFMLYDFCTKPSEQIEAV
jgi:hypothetical protein